MIKFRRLLLFWATLFLCVPTDAQESPSGLTLAREQNWLIIRGGHLPGGEIRINYLEAYCRPNSTDADWHDTTIGHQTELTALSEDRKTMKLVCKVNDGIVVEHEISASDDEVTFAIRAVNPTDRPSLTHWAQPCIRLGEFTGFPHRSVPGSKSNLEDYLPKCFVFLDQRLVRLSEVEPWAKEARYVPGQVWCPADVPRTDVNPRPLSSLVPSNGLIGCFSHDDRLLFAVTFEPYQELFQGVARCLHADFRLGGLAPGETKTIDGRIYILANDVDLLLKRYREDFPGK